MELYFHSPTRVDGEVLKLSMRYVFVMWYLVKHRDTYAFLLHSNENQSCHKTEVVKSCEISRMLNKAEAVRIVKHIFSVMTHAVSQTVRESLEAAGFNFRNTELRI